MDFRLQNMQTVAEFKMGVIPFLFMLVSYVLVLSWISFVSMNTDATYGQINFNLAVIGIIPLLALIAVSGIFGTLKDGYIVFFPSGTTNITSVIQSIGVALLLGFIFGGFTLAFSPIKLFSFSYSLTDTIQSTATTMQYYLNYSVVPAFNEEIVFAGFLMLIVVLLTRAFNFNKSHPNYYSRGVNIAIIAIAVTSLIFAGEHYFAYSTRLNADFQSYQSNPTSWNALYPNAPIPQNPSSLLGVVQIIGSIGVAGLFRIFNTVFIIATKDIYQGVFNHAIVNAFILVQDNSLPTYGQWGFVAFLILGFVAFGLLENVFAKRK
jgi:hypothetical protein